MEEQIESSKDNPKWGGARPGSGRPKGSMNPESKERVAVEAAMRQRILQSADKLLSSQMNLAEGTQMLFKINEIVDENGKKHKGKPELVTAQWEIENYLAGEYDDNEGGYYFITTERPDNKALDSLFDRVFGKSTQNIDLTSKGDKVFNIPLTEEELKAYARIRLGVLPSALASSEQTASVDLGHGQPNPERESGTDGV